MVLVNIGNLKSFMVLVNIGDLKTNLTVAFRLSAELLT